jgi:hypothetical protein
MAQTSTLNQTLEVSQTGRLKSFLEAPSIQWFSILLTAAFSSIELVNTVHHVMWRDELQVWMIARHSHSIAELISLKRYEGHPDAWFLLVYFITKVTANLLWMQVVHVLVASATAFVIALYSPFTRVQKILIVFGYFLFFEYATISREYALGILGIFIFCAVFRPGPKKNYLLLALVLAFICQTGIYAVIVALAFILAMLFEAVQTPSWRQTVPSFWWQFPLGALIVLSSLGLSLLHIRPPPDGGLMDFHLGLKGLSDTLSMFWTSFVPIPQWTRTFWNTNILKVPGTSFHIMTFLALAVLGVSVLFFLRKPFVLIAYVVGAAGLLLFKQFVFHGYLRHDGFAFILFLACLWLAAAFPEKRFPQEAVERIAKWFTPLQPKVLLILLIVQAGVGLAASCAPWEIPFSEASSVAQFIRSNRMDGWPIIGDQDFATSTVAADLNRKFFYLMGQRTGDFIIWDKQRLDSTEPVMAAATEMAARLHHKVLVILSYPSEAVGKDVKKIASFQGAIVPDENYYLFIVGQ